MFDNDLDDLSLGELFQVADSIGDKYFTDDELAKRSAELIEAQAELDRIINELNLDD